MAVHFSTGTSRLRGAGLLGAAALLGAGACSSTSPTGIDPEPTLEIVEDAGVVLMTQNVIPTATMEALFEGRVVADEDGCLRLDSADGHTVVWPHGYGLSGGIGQVRILDRDGEPVGTVGGEFSLGGGEVTELLEAMGFTADDRARAEERCPGRYWIVS